MSKLHEETIFFSTNIYSTNILSTNVDIAHVTYVTRLKVHTFRSHTSKIHMLKWHTFKKYKYKKRTLWNRRQREYRRWDCKNETWNIESTIVEIIDIQRTTRLQTLRIQTTRPQTFMSSTFKLLSSRFIMLRLHTSWRGCTFTSCCETNRVILAFASGPSNALNHTFGLSENRFSIYHSLGTWSACDTNFYLCPSPWNPFPLPSTGLANGNRSDHLSALVPSLNLLPPMASISSMKITHGWCSLA